MTEYHPWLGRIGTRLRSFDARWTPPVRPLMQAARNGDG